MNRLIFSVWLGMAGGCLSSAEGEDRRPSDVIAVLDSAQPEVVDSTGPPEVVDSTGPPEVVDSTGPPEVVDSTGHATGGPVDTDTAGSTEVDGSGDVQEVPQISLTVDLSQVSRGGLGWIVADAARVDSECGPITLGLDGVVIHVAEMLPAIVGIDWRELGHGERTIGATAECSGAQVDVSETVSVPDHSHGFELVSPGPSTILAGDFFRASVQIVGSEAVTATATLEPDGEDLHTTVLQTGAGSHVAVASSPVGHDGAVALAINTGSDDSSAELRLHYRVHSLPRIPLEVLGAVFVAAERPPAELSSSDAPAPVIGRFPNTANVDVPEPSSEQGIAVSSTSGVTLAGALSTTTSWFLWVDGYFGYYVLPADASVTDIQMTRSNTEPGPGHALNLRVAAYSPSEGMGEIGSATLNVSSLWTPPETLRFSVSWDTPTDIDLHVVDPSGCEVYYGSPVCPSGGELADDSNSGCGLEGIQSEVVEWPNNSAPLGEYLLRVELWSRCSTTEPTRYTASASYCGRTSSYFGELAPEASSAGGAGAGETALVVQHAPDCTRLRGQLSVAGWGGATSGGPRLERPLRHTRIRLRAANATEILASGYTDGQGRFDLPLNTLPQAFLAVEVVAELDARHAPVSVVDGEGHPRVATFFYPTHVDSDAALQLVVRDGEAHRALERLALLEEAYVELATRHGDALGEILVREEAGWVSPGFCISGAGGCEDEGALSVAASYSHGPMPLVAALARYSLAKLTGASPDMSRPVDGVSGLAWTWAVGASWYIAAELRGESDFVTQTQPGVFIKHPVGGAVGWEPVGGWGSTDVQGTELEPSDVARALHRLARLSDDGASLNHLMVVLFETMARPDVSVPPDFAVFLRAWVCTPGPAADLGVEAALAEVGLIWSREDIECD